MSVALAENPADLIIEQPVLPGLEEWAAPAPERLLGLLDTLDDSSLMQPARTPERTGPDLQRSMLAPVPAPVRVAALALDAALGRQPGGASLAALPVRELVQHSKSNITVSDRALLVGPAKPNDSLSLSDTADGQKGADAYPRGWLKEMDEEGRLADRWERFAGMSDEEIDDALLFEVQLAHLQKFTDKKDAKIALKAKQARMQVRREEITDALLYRKQLDYLKALDAKKEARAAQRDERRATKAENRQEKIAQRVRSAVGAVASFAKTGGDWRNRVPAAILSPTRLIGY